MKHLFFILMAVFFCSGVWAQCPQGNITFSSQAQINNFVANYPNCTEMPGQVIISGTVTSLDVLSQITSIEVALSIRDNTALTSLAGLDNLTSVGGTLYIMRNTALTSLAGIDNIDYTTISSLRIEDNPNLSVCASNSICDYLYSGEWGGAISDNASGCDTATEIITACSNTFPGCSNILLYSQAQIDDFSLNYGNCTELSNITIESNPDTPITNLNGLDEITMVKSLVIRTNDSLPDLSGLNNLTSVEGSLIIENNESLASLNSLQNLTSIGGELTISENNVLPDLTGLNGLTSIGGNTSIYGDTLASLNGLQNLTSIGGWLILSNNDLPNLTGLENLTSIGGDLFIAYTDILTSLTGLDNLTSVGGTFRFISNGGLTNLVGLGNVTSIGEDVVILANGALTNLAGLENLTYIGGNVEIDRNDALISLTGLENLTSVGGKLDVFSNIALTDLAALGSLTSIGGRLSIGRDYPFLPSNSSLSSLAGLENLTSVGGDLLIIDNPILTSLTGLDNLTIGGDLEIFSNPNLSICDVTGICNYLQSGGTASISDNASGCSSIYEVQFECMPVVCLDAFVPASQEEVDNFPSDYPNCTTIEYLDITYPFDITNLDSLIQLVTITGSVEIGIFAPNNISDISGLQNVKSIGGHLAIGNTQLTDLSGLQNLTSVTNGIQINNNPNLTTLSGLENISPDSIGGLYIADNQKLWVCNLSNICTYLADGGNAEIFSNAFGCNNQTQVEITCNPVLCPQGYLTLDTQQKVDNFSSNYPGCTELSGSLSIYSHNSSDPINNLNGLSHITSIAGYFGISRNDSLTSLAGLENLNTVGSLGIYDNNALTSLEGLDNLNTIDSPPLQYNIAGRLEVYSNQNLTSLAGLENLSTVGSINIDANSALTSLEGLDNVNTIDGNLRIDLNNALTSFAGLENLTMVGHLSITYNSALNSLEGLENLTSVAGSVSMRHNNNLTSLSGLDNLNSVGDYLSLYENDALVSIEALTSLNTVGGNLGVTFNAALTSLTGLDNVTSIGGNLFISNNSNLSLCDITPVCNYIINGGNGDITISGNGSGCINLNEVQNACLSLTVCPDNIYAPSQEYIDNFPINYPGCTEIPGNVVLWPDLIDNLDGLSEITSIGGNLDIEAFLAVDYFTTDISGLQNITTIGGSLNIITDGFWENPSLDAFQNLTSIGGGLDISYNGFTDLSPLQNLTSIGDNLSIYNEYITSLEGLENIDYTTITNLYISWNYALSVCDFPNICTYLENGGTAIINNNAPGCDSQQEIELLCTYPCTDSQTTTDSITYVFDEDLFIDGIGFANNSSITFTDPGSVTNTVLSDISLEVYFRLNGTSCENEIAIQITDPAGNTQPLTAYTTCDGGTGLYYINLDIPSANTTNSIADWVIEFDDTDDQNADYEYSVRFARLNYVATTTGGDVTIVNEVSEYADSDLFIDGIGFENNGTYTFPDPSTPTDAVLSDISLELYFRLNGNSCENEIALQITDPAGNPQALTAYTTCDGGTGLYYVNLDVPSGNTTGSPANWTVEFDDTNDQNTDYEYSVRFGRLTYKTTTTSSGGGFIIENEVSDYADADLFIDGVGFANNGNYTFTDLGTPANAILSDISLELYFRLNGNSCENEIALQITDPAGNTQALTAYTTCDGGTGLYYVNLDVPNGNTTGNIADWTVEFDDTNDQNTDYEYSVRFGRLTYQAAYNICDEMMMITEENTSVPQHINTPTQTNVSTSARQHISTFKLYPVPATQHLNVDYKAEFTSTVQLEIISNSGRTLMTKEELMQVGLNTVQFDIAELPAGHYYIRTYSADDVPQMQPFIKIAP